MIELKTSEWVIVLATLAGPVLAVQAQKFIERARETRQRRLRLFYTLMGTRASRVSSDHVQALNMIDIEFYGRRLLRMRFQKSADKNVIDAWKIYKDHLNERVDATGLDAWARRSDDLFVDLLHSISLAVGYEFDKVQLKRGVYFPKAHDENEMAQLLIRDSLVKILTGEKPLPMAVTSFPFSKEANDLQMQLQEALLKQAKGDVPLKVRVENPVKTKQ